MKQSAAPYRACAYVRACVCACVCVFAQVRESLWVCASAFASACVVLVRVLVRVCFLMRVRVLVSMCLLVRLHVLVRACLLVRRCLFFYVFLRALLLVPYRYACRG